METFRSAQPLALLAHLYPYGKLESQRPRSEALRSHTSAVGCAGAFIAEMPRRANHRAALAALDLPGTCSHGYRPFPRLEDLKSAEMQARTNDLLVLASVPCYDNTRGELASGLPGRELGGWRDKVCFFFRTCAQAAMIWQLKLDA